MLDCQIKDPTSDPNLISPAPSGKGDSKMKAEKEGGKLKWVGLSERMEIERMRRLENGIPDSWISRKFMIGVVLAIYAYTYYVFVVRVAIPMIRMDSNRLGSHGEGITYLVVYHLLFIMFLWSYAMVIFHGPGFAVDYIAKTDPPIEDVELVEYLPQTFEHLPSRPSKINIPRKPPSSSDNASPEAAPAEQDPNILQVESQEEQHPTAGAFGPIIAKVVDQFTEDQSPFVISSSPVNIPTHSDPSLSTSSPPVSLPSYPPPTHFKSPSSPASSSSIPVNVSAPHSPANSYLHFPGPSSDYEPEGFRPVIERQPVQRPVLTQDYRYDSREGIVRPYRSHRCRHCATTILRMDHHCPWVGGCVGAKNHKYFINFVQWSSIFTLFVFISLIVTIASPFDPTRSRPALDGQIIAIIIISGLFTLFTTPLYAAHVRLALLNTTTIEELAIGRMRARERAALSQVFGFSNWRGKKATKKAWDLEWGRVGKEGNLWWLGSRKANWEMLMGKNPIGWFLPIPAQTEHDGISYLPNPRHSKEGYWRRRKEWDESLR